MENSERLGSGNRSPADTSETQGPKSKSWPDVPEKRGVEETSGVGETNRAEQMQHADDSDGRPVQERGASSDGAEEQRGLQENIEGSDF